GDINPVAAIVVDRQQYDVAGRRGRESVLEECVLLRSYPVEDGREPRGLWTGRPAERQILGQSDLEGAQVVFGWIVLGRRRIQADPIHVVRAAIGQRDEDSLVRALAPVRRPARVAGAVDQVRDVPIAT